MRAHVNQSTMILYYSLSRDEMVDSLARINKESSSDDLTRAWVDQIKSSLNRWTHEVYHYWQGLGLPFMNRFALLAMQGILESYKRLAAEGKPLHSWNIHGFTALDISREVWWIPSQGRIVLAPDTPGLPRGTWTLTPQRLLETAASMAEFQMLNPTMDALSPQIFERWRKRHATYLDGYKVTSTLMGKELALLTTLPIINTAFKTSQPVRAFVELTQMFHALTVAAKNFRESLPLLDPQKLISRIQDILGRMLGRLAFDSDVVDGPGTGHLYYLINADLWRRFDHPFTSPHGQKWAELMAKGGPASDLILSGPAFLDRTWLSNLQREFSPRLIFISSPGDAGRPVLVIDKTKRTPDSLRRTLTAVSIITRANSWSYTSTERICPHQACPEWEPGYCHTYLDVPDHWEDCKFLQDHTDLMKVVRQP